MTHIKRISDGIPDPFLHNDYISKTEMEHQCLGTDYKKYIISVSMLKDSKPKIITASPADLF